MKTHFKAVNLQLHVIHSFIATQDGACSICGLPGHLCGLMSIPGVPGQFCCIECVECVLCGPGKCRWCSFHLDSNQSAFCSEECRAMNETCLFGSGKRFALWLSRHEPRLFADLVDKEMIPKGIACLNCGDSLDDKRQDSLYCGVNCQHCFRRSNNRPKQGNDQEKVTHSQCADGSELNLTLPQPKREVSAERRSQ